MKRFMALLIFFLFTSLSVFTFVSASEVPAFTVLEPTGDFYVLDAAGVFPYEIEKHIVLNNDVLYDACGAQIVFIAIDTTGSTNINDYAYKLFNSWGIGSKENNNGILVLMAINDDNYAWMFGRGIESELSSSQFGKMASKYLEPDFAARDYAAGAHKLFDALYETVAAIYEADVSLKDYTSEALEIPNVEAIEITPKDLFDAYEANMIAAEKKYMGQTLIIKGEVGDIKKGALGNFYITLKVDEYNVIQCNFDESHIDALAELSKGDIVEVIGICGSMSIVVRVNDCRFVDGKK